MTNNSIEELQPSLSDLTACEREQIQAPGGIEPNGAMLVFRDVALTIIQASSNTGSMLGVPPETLLGMHLGDLFSSADVCKLISGVAGDGKRRYVTGLQTSASELMFDALVHRLQGLLIIELEPCAARASETAASGIYATLTDSLAELNNPLSLTDLCQRIVTRIRRITGFDRVMVYRFLHDDSGFVIAEDRRDDLTRYLGLRYPASDIPAQARRLYLINMLRLKPDVDAPSAVLIPTLNPFTGGPLDMTHCILRAMSPVHVEYLRNMGVAASMSLSILKEGKLWGLIACHHGEPMLVPHPTRITCELLTSVFSCHIASAEEEEKRAHTATCSDLTSRIGKTMRSERNVIAALIAAKHEMKHVLGAQGCAFRIRGKTMLVGTTPESLQVEKLLAWLDTDQNEHIFATERMAGLPANAGRFTDETSGLLSLRINLGSPDFALWFRPAIVQTTIWAGNPDKPVEETEAGRRISPRRSFEKWRQTSRDSSGPWTGADREFASSLRPVIAETLFLQMNEEIRGLNLELSRSNVELKSFAYSASHDLQEPVRMIHSYAQLLAQTAGNTLTAESRDLLSRIENGSQRMRGLISSLLSYSQLGGMEKHESGPIDLSDVLRWVRTNLEVQIQETGALITLDVLPVVWGNLDYMVQLFQNLISNAMKYRRQDAVPLIHLSASDEGTGALLAVRDNGQGFEAEYAEMIFEPFKRLHGREVPGNGIGLATCKRIVEIHGGRIWAESPGNNLGATFWLTLPEPSVDDESRQGIQ